MGKALIIKGADFSTNAIEGINLDGKRILTQDNADSTFAGMVTYNSTRNYINFSTSGSNYTFKIYKIFANEMLVIPRQTNNIELFFINDLPSSQGVSYPAFSNLPELLVSPQSFIVDKGVTIKGDKDYYLVVSVNHNLSNVNYLFPSEIYVTQEYNPNRNLTEENYDSKVVGKYINNSTHSWGNDSNGVFYFFNVFQGETVHIKANSTKATSYAIFSQNIQIGNGTLPLKTDVSINTEVDVPITEIGQCICIKKQADNTTNCFPEELYTYQTPIQTEE